MKAHLLALFENITVNELSYCLLCYKTSEERMISVSKNLSNFLETLNWNISCQWNSLSSEEKTTCFVCEAKLEKAASLVRMLKFGIKMKNLLTYCQEKRTMNSVLNTCLLSNKPKSELSSCHPMFMLASECQKHVLEVQKLSDLETTEVLTIDTTEQSKQTEQGADKDDDDVVFVDNSAAILPDKEVNKIRKKIKNKKPNPPKSNNTPEITNVSSTTTPATLDPLRATSPLTQNPLLFSSLMTPQKPIPLNTLNKPNEYLNKMIARQNEDGNYELHQIVIGSDGIPYIPSLPAKLVDGQIVMIGESSAISVDLTESAIEPKIVSNSQLMIKDARDPQIEEIRAKKRKIEDMLLNVGVGPDKLLQPSTHSVDWEDKIPMDVITYVDATDPNMSSNIMQKREVESILPDAPSTLEIKSAIASILPDDPPIELKADPDLIDITEESIVPMSNGIGIISSCFSQKDVDT